MSIGSRWEEELYIGQGGFSEVYRVKQNGKYYALKKIFPSVLKKPSLKEGIMREIKIMESLEHPKIIKLYEVIKDEDEISLLLEYAEGGSVYDQLKIYGKLPEHQVKQYVKDLIEALEYLHHQRNPILHRDIKPQNLLIASDHHCRLADFGSANIMDGIRTSYAGSECYMAPQVQQRQPHGIPYDVWCVGFLIYQLLTGSIWNPETRIIPSYLSRAAQDVIKKLLVKQPQKRMTISQLKQHIWLCETNRRVRKMSSSKRVNKMVELEKRINSQIQAKAEEWKGVQVEDHVFKKEPSAFEQNKQLNAKSQEYIRLVKEREKLKEEIMKNQKIIDKQERRKRAERPYLLQQIHRLKSVIKEYQNNISILKIKPLRKEAQCKLNIKTLGKRIEDLTQYIKEMPQRLESDALYFSDYEPQVELLPIREHILKMETEMLIFHRDALIELVTAKKTNREIKDMIQIHRQLQMSQLSSQRESIKEEIGQSTHHLMGSKDKTL